MPPSFQVAQYQMRSIDNLKNKLMQFPKGTSFLFSSPGPKKNTKILSDLKAWAKERHIEIIEAPPL